MSEIKRACRDGSAAGMMIKTSTWLGIGLDSEPRLTLGHAVGVS
jgi:hypothetical protein